MRRKTGSPKILVSGNWLFQSSVSWCWPKGTWALGTRLPRSNRKPAFGQWSTLKNTWFRWVAALSPRYWSADTLFWQMPIAHNITWRDQCPISKKYTVNQGCMSLSTNYLEYGCHVARLHRRRRRRRRRRAYAPTSNTAAHDNHEKFNSWVSFSLYGYGAPLGGSSAIIVCKSTESKIFLFTWFSLQIPFTV